MKKKKEFQDYSIKYSINPIDMKFHILKVLQQKKTIENFMKVKKKTKNITVFFGYILILIVNIQNIKGMKSDFWMS